MICNNQYILFETCLLSTKIPVARHAFLRFLAILTLNSIVYASPLTLLVKLNISSMARSSWKQIKHAIKVT